MINDTTTPPRPPAWLNLDDVLPPETRQRLEQHQRSIAETIVAVRGAFEDAQAQLAQLERPLGELPEEGFEWIMDHTVYGNIDRLLRAFAGVVAPDDVMTGNGDELDAELAKVPGLGR